jgi:excinuclease UvrABC nuclease subunit
MEMNPVHWQSVTWQEAKQIPAKPGCYALIDANNKILYIGRSKILWNRLRNPSNHPAFNRIALEKCNLKIAWITGWNAYDSERSLILRWKPPLCQERIKTEGLSAEISSCTLH